WKGGAGITCQVKAGVDGYAVPADRNPWVVNVRIGLTVRGGDHRPDIDTDLFCVGGELIGEGDIDISIGGLNEFGEFCAFHGPPAPNTVWFDEIGPVINLED